MTDKSKANYLKAHGMIFLATCLTAGSFLASNNLSGIASPISLTLLRFIIAALLLAPFVLGRKEYRSQLPEILPRSMVISFFFSGYFVSQFEALKTTTVLNTGTIYTLTPLVTALFCLFIFKDTISRKRLLTYICGAIGTLWVVFGGSITEALSLTLNQGDFIFLLGVACMSGYTISLRYFYRGNSLIAMTFGTLLGGSIWMGIFTLFGDTPLNWHLIEGTGFISMAYLAIPATLLTSYFFQKSSVVIGPSSVTSYIYLNPACVAIFALFFYGDTINPSVWVGILISVFATFFLQEFNRMPRLVPAAS